MFDGISIFTSLLMLEEFTLFFIQDYLLVGFILLFWSDDLFSSSLEEF